uniref:Uncharacterized protein n=1 Tax=Avena sativa TaxID=4498 RepID=A0ACD5TAY3_AVESA
MRTEIIRADNIDLAVEKILVELGAETASIRENAIYFDSWDGLGASAVLQAVARRLRILNELATKPMGLEFDEIIHIDCSKWESRRAMQRKIAEQLKLPVRVFDIFDKQDEEDDFNRLEEGSRGEIAQVTRAIYKTIQNRRFLVILHNGSNEEIDIFNFGISLYGYANSKMLWTFQGRFRLDTKMIDNVKKSTTTHVLLSASRDKQDPEDLYSYLVHNEAAQVSCDKHGHTIIIDPAIVVECVLYMLKQYSIGSHIVHYDWPIHAGNYWVCNGNIPPEKSDRAWQVVDVLQRESWFFKNYNRLNSDESKTMHSSHLATSVERMQYWMSMETCGFVQSHSGIILENMLKHSHMLGVLKLSWCTFSFLLPPFLCCHSLRFLWLEHCQDLGTGTSSIDHYQKDAGKESWECFKNLWVLDLRYTDCAQILSAQVMDLMMHLRELNVMGARNWDMSHLHGRLCNIRKLRVTKSTCCFNNNVFSEMESIELLDFSGNTIRQGMASLSGPASNTSLTTIIIDGCDGLEVISFRGCKELKDLFLKGSLGSLEVLDLSGTKVKILDLGGVQSTLPKRIILLGCEKLRAILWPKRLKRPDVLQIDTTSTSISVDGGEARRVHPHADRSLQQQKEEKYKNGWQISLMDARLLRSLSPVKGFLQSEAALHIDIYSPAMLGGGNFQGTRSDKLGQVQPCTSAVMESEYRDILKDDPVEVMMMWECPQIRRRWWGAHTTCIIKVITNGQATNHLEDATSGSTSALLLPSFICKTTNSLHVYDNSSITSIPKPPKGYGWKFLVWCRVERCPKLHTVFTLLHGSDMYSFEYLQTFWASQLLSARYISDKPYCFNKLDFLHVDHCPRLVHVLPLSTWWGYSYSLETLEIVYCGDLKEVFPLDPELQEQDRAIEFPKLRRIHLHELPKLQHIRRHRMSAPRLETIKIRGSWSLRHLPLVAHDTKPPKVDCEKEWWDCLEWDGLEKYHHPSLYEPIHSLYYKAQLPRVSVLR